MTIKTLSIESLRPYLKTTYDVKEFIESLQNLQKDIFQKHTTLTQSLETQIPAPLSTILKKLATEQKIHEDDLTESEHFLLQLQEAITAIPSLQLTISFSPTLSLINQINDWLLLHVPEHVILDFTTDRSIIGGAQIAFHGKYKDYSLKKEVTKLFTQNN